MQTFNDIETDELLKALAVAREQQASYKSIAAKIIEEAKASENYQYAAQAAEREGALIETLSAEIKTRALAIYSATSEKKPFPGVTVKVFKNFVIQNQEAMEKWVETNLAAAVKRVFDMKVIETFAKSNPIPGTEIQEEPRAEIASKLP